MVNKALFFGSHSTHGFPLFLKCLLPLFPQQAAYYLQASCRDAVQAETAQQEK